MEEEKVEHVTVDYHKMEMVRLQDIMDTLRERSLGNAGDKHLMGWKRV